MSPQAPRAGPWPSYWAHVVCLPGCRLIVQTPKGCSAAESRSSPSPCRPPLFRPLSSRTPPTMAVAATGLGPASYAREPSPSSRISVVALGLVMADEARRGGGCAPRASASQTWRSHSGCQASIATLPCLRPFFPRAGRLAGPAPQLRRGGLRQSRSAAVQNTTMVVAGGHAPKVPNRRGAVLGRQRHHAAARSRSLDPRNPVPCKKRTEADGQIGIRHSMPTGLRLPPQHTGNTTACGAQHLTRGEPESINRE